MIIRDDPNTRSGEGPISLSTLPQARQELSTGGLVLSGSGLEAVTVGSACITPHLGVLLGSLCRLSAMLASRLPQRD